ncbi:transcriptional regulator [Streptomyces sp. P38-E01]|uniref:Transcriptional regulator n=1 Tax=Streptomyces tardus TaxID=2780544 RepID=A0A949N5V4_9ACTN|nr:transcriptional regulator [Streptomyces tardus]MBU7598402.1 transcriptional regulator [Streptomyces tardus]
MAARPLVARQPNEQLAGLIREASCSHAGLARRVNLVGAEHGIDLRYDKTSVARWLRGQQPRGRAPEAIAEALGRKLGRTVGLDDIGMSRDSGAGSAGLHFAGSLPAAVEAARELWRGDVGGRESLGSRSVAASALVEPSRDWLIGIPDQRVAHSGAAGRVGLADVLAIEATTEAFAELDHRFGSGNLRPAVVHYLDSVVSELLAGTYRESIGRRLFAAAARLTELAGYMAVDSGEPGLAQRYYIQALRLAQAADDRPYGGYVLAGMSHLACELGSPREISQLARAAQEGTRGLVSPRTSAMFHAAEARGHAAVGDAHACQLAAGRALTAMDRAGSAPAGVDEPRWIAHFDHAYLADELAHCHRDLGQTLPAIRRAEEALAALPADRTRRRAIDLLLLAQARLQLGELGHACGTATAAVKLLGGLRSTLGQQYLDTFRSRLVPHGREREVRDFTARLQGLTVS